MPRIRKERKPAAKRAQSAYLYFAQDARKKLKDEKPDAKFGEIGKIVGQRWKELTEPEKQPYIKQAEADKARYEAETSAIRNED